MLSTWGRRGACGGVGRTIARSLTMRLRGPARRPTIRRGSGRRPVRLPLMSAPTTTPISYTSEELDAVAFDANGLVPAIVQEAGSNEVLMFAWMNREALERTLQTGRTRFWSRSRR